MPRPAAVALAAFLLATASAADPKIEALVAEYDKAKEGFVAGRTAAEQALVKRFDAAVKAAANDPKVKPADRVATVDRLSAQRAKYMVSGELPEDADLADEVWKYATDVDRAYRPLSKAYNAALGAALKAGDDAATEKLRADRRAFDGEHLPGRANLAAKSTWVGTLNVPGKSVGLRLAFDEVGETAFKGHCEQEFRAPGHPKYEVSGSIDGLTLTGKTGASVQGAKVNKTFTGVVVGDRLLLNFASVGAKGKTTPQFGVVELKK